MPSASSPSTLDSSSSVLKADPTPPKPRPTAKGIGLAALCWALYTLLYGLLIAQGENVPLAFALVGQVVANSFLALYSLPVWWLTVREMDRTHWGWVVLVHGIVAPLYAWIGLESYLLLFDAGLGVDLRASLSDRYRWIFFSTLTVYVVQFVVYHLVRNVQRLQQRKQQAATLRARARGQELAALKAQVHPHFLFNTLNSISATLKQDPEQARGMIAKLAAMMRYALDSSDREAVPIREEIDFVRQYLALERHRFSDRLDARVDIDASENDLDTSVPPMVLQPLVENALRHGIAPSEEGGRVRLRVTSQNDHLRIQVDDTGVGPDPEDPPSAHSEGMGLANTSDRLEYAYGPDATLRTAPNEPTGFKVWFSIPRNGTTQAGSP